MEDVVSLKEHFKEILIEKDKALNAALLSAKEAVQIAERNAERWRDQANEWRGAMTDREKTFVTRRELWSAVVALVGAVIGVMAIFIKH